VINIKLDFSDVITTNTLTSEEAKDLVDYTIKSLTATFAQRWSDQARVLGKTRVDYQRSLLVVDEGRFKGAVILTGQLPNMIEEGIAPFDMKLGFSKSDKRKIGPKGGWYLTIPFRLGNPRALGESSAFAGVLPEPVYIAIKEQKGIRPKLSQSQVPAPFNELKVRRAIPKSRAFQEYQHKTSIYAGLQRTRKQYESTTQSTYVVFRRVSANSDPDSWIHTGLTARKFAEGALNGWNIEREVSLLTDQFLVL